jgi:transcription initiation factor TFIIB
LVCNAVLENHLTKGRAAPVLAATSVYVACRVSQTPVTLRELAAVSGLESKQIGCCYRAIVRDMGMTPPGVNGATYVRKIACRAGVPDYTLRLSSEIAQKATEVGLGDRNPMTLAAASIYCACMLKGENKTQADLAEVAGVSEASVRECAKAIRKLLPAYDCGSEGSSATSMP